MGRMNNEMCIEVIKWLESLTDLNKMINSVKNHGIDKESVSAFGVVCISKISGYMVRGTNRMGYKSFQ